jgi:hypothetical protein
MIGGQLVYRKVCCLSGIFFLFQSIVNQQTFHQSIPRIARVIHNLHQFLGQAFWILFLTLPGIDQELSEASKEVEWWDFIAIPLVHSTSRLLLRFQKESGKLEPAGHILKAVPTIGWFDFQWNLTIVSGRFSFFYWSCLPLNLMTISSRPQQMVPFWEWSES